ncbi:hypothetical protein GCM10020220_000300 [Nonomuraea rubra]
MPLGPAPSGSLSDVLVGRRSELALLRSVIGSPPALALVEGEAGIGKSRLVAELLAAPDLAGTRRLVGQCEQLQEPLPLSPLLDAFRSAGAGLARSGLPLNPVAGALAPLLPEIAEHLPPPPPAAARPAGGAAPGVPRGGRAARPPRPAGARAGGRALGRRRHP